VTTYRDRRIYGIEDIATLLREVDRHLDGHARIVIIGGAAAAFHGAVSTTTDVDTHNALGEALEEALERARTITGLDIPVSFSAVADVPYNSEDRFEQPFADLHFLQVFILEKHDLALSKALRCVEHDLQQLEEVHASSPFSFEVLVERFRDEMTHVIGDPARIRANFLELIERLFGELKRAEADRSTRDKPA